MKIRKEWIFASVAAAVIILAAVAVVIASNVGIAGADLNIRSGFFNTSVSMDDIGLALVENGEVIAERRYNNEDMNGSWSGTAEGQLLADLPEKVVLMKDYDEVLQARNTGTINEYVRVSIYKYWLDADGKTRLTELSPELIEIELNDNWESFWQKDDAAHTEERDVYYYTSLLAAGNDTEPLTKSVRIKNDVAKELSQAPKEDDPNTIVTKYKYNGVYFVIEATADGVQENNAAEAITSAWGINANVDENAGSLLIN